MGSNWLKRSDLEDIYTIVDLLASEYGWTIEYISNLTLVEIYGLIKCILRRKGIKIEENQMTSSLDDLVALAKKIGLSKDKIEKLKRGEKVVI